MRVIVLAAFLSFLVVPVTVAQEAFPGWTYTKIGEMPIPLVTASFAVSEPTADSRMSLVFGGSTADGFESGWSTAIRRYSLATNTWDVPATTLPYPYVNNERFGAARASNGRYYVSPGNGWGGWGQHTRIIEVDLSAGIAIERAHVIAPGFNIWGVALAPAPAAQGGVYLLGGWNGGGVSTVSHYNPVTDQMTVLGHLSVGRTVGARVTHPNGRIYVFGANWYGLMAAVDVLETSTGTVRAVSNPQGFTFDHSTQGWVGTDGAIYLWNAIAPHLGSGSGRIIRFDPVTETFSNPGTTPGAGAHPVSLVADPQSAAAYAFSSVTPGYVWGVSGEAVSGVWKLSPPAVACAFGPATPFVATRTTAKPLWEELVWESCGGAGTMTIANAGTAAAVVILNGVEVDFRAAVSPVTLPEGANTLRVQMRSKPGSTLAFSFTEQ